MEIVELVLHIEIVILMLTLNSLIRIVSKLFEYATKKLPLNR